MKKFLISKIYLKLLYPAINSFFTIYINRQLPNFFPNRIKRFTARSTLKNCLTKVKCFRNFFFWSAFRDPQFHNNASRIRAVSFLRANWRDIKETASLLRFLLSFSSLFWIRFSPQTSKRTWIENNFHLKQSLDCIQFQFFWCLIVWTSTNRRRIMSNRFFLDALFVE